MALRKTPRKLLNDMGLAPGVSTKERTRLIALFFIMGVVTIAMLGGLDKTFAGFRRKGPPTPVEGESAARETIDIGVEVVPWTFDPAFLEARISEKSVEDRVKEYPEALAELGRQFRLRPHTQFLLDPVYRETRGFLTPTPAAVLADPKFFRAKPVEFNGTLIDAALVDTKAEFGVDLNFDFASQWIGTLRIDDPSDAGGGKLVTFLFLDEGAGQDPRRDLLNRRVKLQGVFYRLRDVRSDDRYETTVFLLGKKLVRALSIPTLTTDVKDLAARIDDSTEERQQNVYDETFFESIGYAFLSPPATLAARGEAKKIEGRDGWDRAEDFRLANVRLHGVVMHMAYEPFEYAGKPFELVRQSDAACTGWYTTYVADPRADGLYVVGTMTRPEGVEKGSEIEVDAVYYKRLLFLNRGTVKPGEAPPGYDPAKHGRTKSSILFATAPIRAIHPPKPEDRTVFKWTLVGVVCLSGSVLALFVARDRRRARELGDALRHHKSALLRSRGVDLTAAAQRTGDAAGPGGPPSAAR